MVTTMRSINLATSRGDIGGSKQLSEGAGSGFGNCGGGGFLGGGRAGRDKGISEGGEWGPGEGGM